jgi:hypothetical protein
VSLDEKNEKILNWLSPSNVQDKQNDVFNLHHADTGQWLVRSQEFRQWLDGNSSVLWCCGDRKCNYTPEG